MVDYETKAPGVYIEEQPASGPITGVGTSTAALIGTAVGSVPAANLGVPVPITSWTEYVTQFGGFKAGQPLPYAVRGFFDNGGTMAYIVPVKDVKDSAGMAAALDGLTRVQDASLVCAPGAVDSGIQGAILNHCETMANRFAIL